MPLSTKIKESPYYHKITFKGIDQCVVLSQIKTVDSKRFGEKMGELTEDDFKNLKAKIFKLINDSL